MIKELSQSLIDELNLVKIDSDESRGLGVCGRTEYGFSDFIPDSGHLLWLYNNGRFGMAKQIYMNNDDSHFWWCYAGSINFQTENEVRNHLYHLRASIKNGIKECKERIVKQKLRKIQMDF